MPSPPPKSICEMVWPSARSTCTKSASLRQAISKRAEIGDLAADMHVDAGDLQSRQLGGPCIDGARMRDRDAELVLGLAGRDFGMGAGIDIGIDAHGDARGLARLHREARQQLELVLGFDVDAEDVGGKRGAQLRPRSCRRRKTGSCRRENLQPARASTRRRKRHRRRRRASPACAAPTGWSSPSWRSRPASSRRQRPR